MLSFHLLSLDSLPDSPRREPRLMLQVPELHWSPGSRTKVALFLVPGTKYQG